MTRQQLNGCIIKRCTNLDEVVNDVNDLVNCVHCHGPFCYCCCFSLCVCLCVSLCVCPHHLKKRGTNKYTLVKMFFIPLHTLHLGQENSTSNLHPPRTIPGTGVCTKTHLSHKHNHLQTIQVVNKYLCLKCDRLQMDKRTEGLTVLHVHVHGKVPPSGRGSVLTHLSQEVDGLPRQQDLQPSSGHPQLQ